MSYRAVLDKLGLTTHNAGACTGIDDWIEDAGDPIVSSNPATGEVLGTVSAASPATYDQVITTAQRSFETWRSRPAPARGQLIRDLGDALREFRDPLGELVTLEMGKIRPEGIGEVQEMIDICDFAVGLSRQQYGLTMPSERPGHRMFEQWHPLGPIGIVSAFNFPVAVWSWNAAIAAVCGNTNIWKPSPTTPLVAVAVQHICNRVMADHGVDGVFNLIVGSNESIGESLVADSRLPLVSFTGSTEVGRHVAQIVAGRLGRSLLELGGNNAIIVAQDADLDLAVRGILFGAVGTAGQRCTSTRRVIAHRSIANELCERLCRAYTSVPIGNPIDPDTLMGPLISEAAVATMIAAIACAGDEGGTVICGGSPRADLGPNYVTPAIVRMPAQTAIVLQETFAPILYVMEFDSLDHAITLQNAASHGLSSAIFTSQLAVGERFVSHAGSDCGIANVNIGTSGAEIGGAFGGEKDTGGGRESGSDAWKTYMRRQTCTINGSGQLPLAQGIEFGQP